MAKLLFSVLFAAATGLHVDLPDKIFGLQKNLPAIEGKPVVQMLRSDEGMAYYGAMYVGGQEQVSIYDTGSFDIVVESKCAFDQGEVVKTTYVQAQDEKGHVQKIGIPSCCSKEKCPYARYSSILSGTNFEASNKEIEQMAYGSGPCIVKPGYDYVSVSDDSPMFKTRGNKIGQGHVPVKIIVDHEIELFNESDLTAIVGVGPGPYADRKNRLMSVMGVKRFMVCFQENANANGFWTWNDIDRSKSNDWVTVPVVGKQFWAVPTSNFMLGGESMGCDPSCGGIIDTGTSLLTPPQPVINAITKKLESGDIEDCSDISLFPDFEFQLGDHKFTLPSSTYIGDAGVQQVEVFHQHLAFKPLPMTKKDLNIVKQAKKAGKDAPAVHTCVLMLSPGDDSEVTQFGPMVIFGMSLFRKYAAHFDLSGDLENTENARFMRFAEAAKDCSGPVKGGEFRRKSVLQKVNLDKLRVSSLQQRLSRNRKKFGTNLNHKNIIRI